MVTTSQIQLPTRGADTPTPAPTLYRLDTSAVVVVHRPILTAELTAIREAIEPNRGVWQFPIRRWHVAVYLGSYFTVVGSFVVFAVLHGAVR